MIAPAKPTAGGLPLHRVDVVEPAGRSARGTRIPCVIGKHLRFDTKGLESYCFSNWDERIFDALVVAAAVQFCDHTKRRPRTGWGREIQLRVPVHDPGLWASPTVSESLHDTLRFLTGDRWHLEFLQRAKPESAPRQGNLNLSLGEGVVIAFSDGLDSHAVAGLAERKHAHKLFLVRLGAQPRERAQPRSERTPFALVPYRVRYAQRNSLETSARSRGFRFALLSGIAAYMCQSTKVIVPESGQGALGPALVPVGQAYDDYRNHPLFTDRMTVFLSALFGREIHYTFPRLWYTKAETLAAYLAACPDPPTWRYTRSCWQGQRHTSVLGHWRQCGICTACLVRRMSVHAAGAREEPTTYVWETLSLENFEDGAAEEFRKKLPQGALHEHAIAGTLYLDNLAGLLQSQASQVPLAREVFHLSRSLRLPEHEARTRLERLLTRHRTEWRTFLGSLGARSFLAHWAVEGP